MQRFILRFLFRRAAPRVLLPLLLLLPPLLGGAGWSAEAPVRFGGRQLERLGRGVVAVRLDDGSVYTGWRILGTDPEDIGFHVFRRLDGGEEDRLTAEPVTATSDFVDAGAREIPEGAGFAYFIRPVAKGVEGDASAPAPVREASVIEVPIDGIADYRPGDASVGDLDGDGEYELVLHQVSDARDNSHAGVTGRPILDAYELDGTRLWRIDLGINIREGEHYTQFVVYDLDGDGRAEIACKTADGTTDGAGSVIGDPGADWRTLDRSSRSYGRVLDGPEFLTVFDGATGAALATVDYVPGRDPIDGWGGIGGNGGNDDYGNRCDRFLACAAYLDGERPSLVMCRGVYGRTVIAAWDWRDGELTQRWVFDSGISYPPYTDASPFSGMGGHSLGVADVDGDGRDEIVYQAMTIDDDGNGLYSTGRRHGDAMHVGDFDPDRPGLELFLVTENEDRTTRLRTLGVGMHDARTGELLWGHSPGVDVVSCLAANIDPQHPGCEAWGGPGGLRTARGEEIGPAPRPTDWAVWWDGDPLRELLGRRGITKWNWESGDEETIQPLRIRRYAGRPTLAADILGDWREEIVVPGPDGDSLQIFTTTIPSQLKLPTLMHDPTYRLAIAWQNVAYNKPPHPGFYLGDGMK